MDGIRAQPGAGLAAPTSRQDVVSALLSAYGSSFTRGDGSPSSFSPVPTIDKELPPPPPPRVDSLRQKPLPSIQRAEQRMTMKFQLRVDEDTPPSPTGTNGRRKIMYRSLSRGAKPPSLTLTVSNGSTAVVPPTPVVTLQSQRSPVTAKYEEKLLPSPPPPPVKSERRTSSRPAGSNQQPKSHSPLVRNDSLLSQGEKKVANSEAVPGPAPAAAPLTDMASVVKRKALPIPAVRKFRSLAELGAGPRGGKAGPLPTSAPRKNSTGDANSVGSPKSVSRLESIEKPIEKKNDPVTINRLPPTPEDEKFGTLPAPAPPRKAFIGMGLPSNPRAKGGPISPKHVRGKSSTGFNVLKAQRPAPPPPIAKMDTITPEMTPSPKLKPNDEAKMDIISPVSPLPPPTERRPFSFEPIKRPGLATTPVPNQQVAALSASPETSVGAPIATPPAPSSTSQTMQLQRPTSLDLLDSSPTMLLTAKTPIASPAGTTSAPAPAPAPVAASPPSFSQQPPIPQLPPSPVEESPTTPPPFTPLTRQAMPLPVNLIPAVSPSQLSCYTKHSTSIWSNNTFQPMGCMVCHSNDKYRKWTCTWCRVRICKNCSDELCMIPGRNLGKLLETKQRVKDADMVENQMGSMNGKNTTTMPGIVVSVVGDVEV